MFGAQWIGEREQSGLAVVALTGLTLVSHPAKKDSPPLMAAFNISGRIVFGLLAVWPVERMGGPYHRILAAGLDNYEDFLASSRTIMAGDFNSNSRVKGQEVKHPQFVKRLESIGLVSAYHEQTGELHGEEKVATFLHNQGENREFHIDYCFVAKELKGHARLKVHNEAEWAVRSDHFPLVLDVNDEALS